jgi:hypothetical protein
MSIRPFVSGLALIALTGLGVSDDVAAAGGKSKAQDPVKAAAHMIAGELKTAHKYLAEANHDYQGHRAKAQHEITQAIHQLEKHHHKHHKNAFNPTLNYPHPHHHHHVAKHKEPQAISDAQLQVAGMIVETAFRQLAHLPQDAHTVQAEKDLRAAEHQIALALKVSPKR